MSGDERLAKQIAEQFGESLIGSTILDDSPPPESLVLRLAMSWQSVLLGFGGLLLGVLGTLIMEFDAIEDGAQWEQIAASVTAAPFEQLDKSLDNQLVHVSGATNPSLLTDEIFGVSTTGLILRRESRIYQWDQPLFEYESGWKTRPVYSKRFDEEHQNTGTLPIDWQDSTWNAGPPQLGGYQLSSELLKLFDVDDKLPATNEMLDGFKQLDPRWEIRDGEFYLPADDTRAAGDEPQIGDLRIAYFQMAGDLSVIASQHLGQLRPIHVQGSEDDEKMAYIQSGNVDLDTMLQDAQQESRVGWMVRAVLFVALWGGVFGLVMPFQQDPHNMPLLGRWFAWGFVRTAIVIALAIMLLTLAFVYRKIDGPLAATYAVSAIAAIVIVHGCSMRNSRVAATAPDDEYELDEED